MSELSSFTRSTPTKFSDIQRSRMEQFSQMAVDLAAKQESRKTELQAQCQSLLLEVNTVQSRMANEERDYTVEKERLTTELQKLSIDAQLRFEEAKLRHANRMEDLLNEQTLTYAAVSRENENAPVYRAPAFVASPRLNATQRNARRLEEAAREVRRRLLEDPDENRHESATDDLLESKVNDMESQKGDLLSQIMQRRDGKKAQLMEATVELDNIATANHEDILRERRDMEAKEAAYKRQLEGLLLKMDRIHEQRRQIEQQKKDRVEHVRAEINAIEQEFRKKMHDAARVAEKLKMALMNANMRRAQELEYEKERLNGHSKLLQENCALKHEVARARRELESARQDSAMIRRELAGSIGPRRTASLFL